MDSVIRTIFGFLLDVNVILNLLALAGAWAVLWWSIDNFRSIVEIALSILTPYFQPQERKTLVERYGKWAVVTGATDGIGKQYCKELASHGLNILLISRTEKKLIDVAQEIESTYPVKTKYIVADFGHGKSIYENIKQQMQLLDVGILINNVGRMYDFPDELSNISEDLLWQIMNINVGAVTMMTRMVIPQMKANKRGIIVNISSGSECQPAPMMAVYGATKVFVKNFTLAIDKELEEHNVRAQLVTPMFVQTKMNKYSTSVMKGSVLVPDVESYTKSAVFTLGKSSKTTGYWSHGIQYGCMKIAPDFIRTHVVFGMNKVFRQEYYDQKKVESR